MPDTAEILVGLHGPDRAPWRGGPVTVQLIDPFSETRKILARRRTAPGSDSLLITGIPADAGQRYALLASSSGHRDAALFPVEPKPGRRANFALMLVPDKAAPDLTQFSFPLLQAVSPRFHDALTAAAISEPAFRALAPVRIAGALNIEAKLRHTHLSRSMAVDLIRRIGGPVSDPIRQDRVFAFVDPAMPDLVREEIVETNAFTELLPEFNEVFHRGFPVSFKQRVPFGSLQLSFAREPAADGLLAADIDIDLLTDIGHFGEVLRNKLLRQKTDPFTVYRLLFDQAIAPLYTVGLG